MKNKILIGMIIIVVFVGGLFIGIKFNNKENIDVAKKEENEIRYNLDGIYVTKESKGGSVKDAYGNGYNSTSIQVLTFYPNNFVSLYSISINNVKGFGTSIGKGEIRNGTYTLSNESKTILINEYINGNTKSHTLTFENNYKTLKENNMEYNLLETSLEEYLPRETINDPRDTGFSGIYKREEVTKKSTGELYKGKKISKSISINTIEFLNEGKVIIKSGETTLVYTDGTKEKIHSPTENTFLYSYDKENNSIFVYTGLHFDYNPRYELSKDLKTLKYQGSDEVYKKVEK